MTRWIVTSLIVLGAACGTTPVGSAFGNPLPAMTPQQQRGERLFMHHCHQCHPDGDTGIGPTLLVKVPLDRALTRTQVRFGFGAMPKYTEEVISDQELDALISYLELLRATAHEAK